MHCSCTLACCATPWPFFYQYSSKQPLYPTAAGLLHLASACSDAGVTWNTTALCPAGSASHSLPVTVLFSWKLLTHCPAHCLPFLESVGWWIYVKPRSTAGCRTTKPEETLEVGLMLFRSVYGNGLKRLVIHNPRKTTDLTPTWQATKCLKEKYQN